MLLRAGERRALCCERSNRTRPPPAGLHLSQTREHRQATLRRVLGVRQADAAMLATGRLPGQHDLVQVYHSRGRYGQCSSELANDGRCAAAVQIEAAVGARTGPRCALELAARGRFPNHAVGTNAGWVACTTVPRSGYCPDRHCRDRRFYRADPVRPPVLARRGTPPYTRAIPIEFPIPIDTEQARVGLDNLDFSYANALSATHRGRKGVYVLPWGIPALDDLAARQWRRDGMHLRVVRPFRPRCS